MVLSKEEVGKLVKEARKIKSEKIGKRYTQVMLAKDIDKSQGYIGDIESGRTYPTFMVLSKIAEACSVPFSFFGTTEDELRSDEDSYDSINDSEDKGLAAALNTDNSIKMGPPDILDVKSAMDLILSQPGLMLNGEMLSDESKIALANAIKLGLQYAEQMQKKEKDVNKE
jgi:transcriptional regulator with XRE-family HTH domain